MKILHNTNLWRIELEASQKLFWITWAKESEFMNNDDFKTELKQYLELVKEHQPQKVLLDTSQFLFIVSPEMQTWVDTEVNSQVHKHGVQKIAFLMTSDLFAQVSMEQTVEEENASNLLDISFFDDKEKAHKWLNS